MEKKIMLFDMDGTLTLSTKPITDDVKDILLRCKEKGYEIAVVSGSQYTSVSRQIGEDFILTFDYIFSQNGTNVHKNGELVRSLDILDEIPSDILKRLVEFSLMYIAKLDIPIKRGGFIEHRKSLINVCPVGKNCSQQEREDFAALDKIRHIRQDLINEFKTRFTSEEHPLSFVAGGQISIDVFPEAWNKSLTLTHLPDYTEIHFFGDNTHEGGNDHEIFKHPNVIGHTVKNYSDLIKQLSEMLT